MEKLTISFTGHRIIKDYKSVSNKIDEYLKELIFNNSDKEIVFLTGGARGFDQLVFFKIHKIKKTLKDKQRIKNVLCLPIKNFKVPNLQILKRISDECIQVENLEEYKVDDFRKKFLKRDEYMVDKSDFIVAYYDGRLFGGTKYTIDYATSKEKQIKNIFKEMI